MAESRSRKHRRSPLRSLLLGGGLLAASAFWWIGVWHQLENSPLTRVPMIDERYYMTRSFEISQGHVFPDDPFYMSPLYPFLLWITGSARQLDPYGVIAGHPPLGIRILQATLWLGIVLLLWRTARRLLPRSWSWVPPALFLLYRPAAVMVNTSLLEIPYTFCVTTVLFLLTSGLGPPRRWVKPILIGVLIGLATLLRGLSLVLLVPTLWGLWIGLGSLRRSVAPFAVVAGCALAVMLPAIVHNTRAAGRLAGPSSNAGIVLYAGNGPQANGFQMTAKSFDFDDDPSGAKWLEEVTGRRVEGAAAVDHAWMEESLRFMLGHPLRTLRLWAKKVWLHWIHPEIPNVSPLDAWPRHSSLLRVLFLPYGVLSAFGLAGLMLLGWRPGSWRIWGVTILVLIGAQSLFFVITRYRIVLVPMLALFAGAFLEEVSRRRGRALLLPVGLVIMAVLVVQPWGQRRYLYDLHSAALANEALRWQELGQHDVAQDDAAAAHQAWTQSVSLFTESIERTPRVDFYRDLARSEFFLGREPDARRVLENGIADLGEADRPVLVRDLIRLSVQQGETARALEELRAYAQRHPDDLDMRHLQVVLLARSERSEEALPIAQDMVHRHPENVRGFRDLGLLLARLNRLGEARSVLEEGLQRFPEDAELAKTLEKVREDLGSR